MKLLGKIAAVILVLGIVLSVAGAALGGDLYSSWYNGSLHTWNEARSIGFGQYRPHFSLFGFINGAVHDGVSDAWNETLEDWDHDLDEFHHDVQSFTDDLPDLPAADDVWNYDSDITALEFELGEGDYRIEAGDGFQMSGSGASTTSSWVDGHTWHIESRNKNKIKHHAVVITIPSDTAFDNIEINAGAATVTSCALSAQKIAFSVGAGTLDVESAVADKLEIEVGMGTLSAMIPGTWADYSYKCEVGMGEVTIDGETLAGGLASETRGGSGPRKLELEVGMGTVDLTTSA